MMLLVALLGVAAPAYAELEPFWDERAAGRAYEEHIFCLAQGAFARKEDARDAKTLAAEIVHECTEKGAALRSALAEVYRRKPALIGDGGDADRAADHYLSGAQARIEEAIGKFQDQRK